VDQAEDHPSRSGDLPVGQRFAPNPQEVRIQLEKILASHTFRGAEGQRAFLRYAVAEALAGRGDSLKEYTIGTEAFGRKESFDPRIDPIVRTQARKLRARLSKYFEGEGVEDPLRIEFPKGSYSPLFRSAAPAEMSTATAPVSERVAEEISTPKAVLRPVTFKLRWKIAAVSLAILGLVSSGSAALYIARPALWHGEPRRTHPSIAVMPFVNVSDDKDDEFLSDGLTDELIDSLGQVAGLQVVARTSSFYFKGKSIGLREAGRQLKVGAVLEGSVLRSGKRLRVTVQLNNPQDGYRLWSGSYERESTDVAQIKREISQSITSALGVRFAGGGLESPEAPLHPGSPSPAAYQDYLKGRYSWNKLNAESLKTAIHYFQQAIGEDPSFARAYTALADSYVMAPQVATARPSEVVSKINAAASKALELDPSLGEAHFDLAISAEYEYDWRTAEREFTKGLQLSPGSAVGHLWYAKFLAILGRKPEVMVQRKLAAELDPVSPYALQSIGGYLSVMGHYDEAIDQFQSVLALEPTFGLARQGLGVAYVLQGKPEKGIAELHAACHQMEGPRRKALLGYAYAISGRTVEARQILNDFLRKSRDGSVPALAIAQIYIGLGDDNHAFQWLEKAIDEKDLAVTLQWDSIYEPLRSDRRYLSLLRRMKLA